MTEKNEKKQKKSTLEDALASRMEIEEKVDMEVGIEPTQEEIVTQALGDISARERFEQIPPQVNPPEDGVRNKTGKQYKETVRMPLLVIENGEKVVWEKRYGNKIPIPGMETPNGPDNSPTITETIPVSSIDPRPVTGDSTPGCQEASPQKQTDDTLRRLIEFVNGPDFSVDWVRLHLHDVCRNPHVIPSITTWEGTNFEEIAGAVYATMRSGGFIEECWPSLRVIMGNSRDNIEWSAGILCTMSLFDVIWSLPFPKG